MAKKKNEARFPFLSEEQSRNYFATSASEDVNAANNPKRTGACKHQEISASIIWDLAQTQKKNIHVLIFMDAKQISANDWRDSKSGG